MNRVLRLAVVLAVVGIVAPAARGALVSGTVTNPVDGAHIISDATAGVAPNMMTFSGAVSVSGGTVPVVACHYRGSAGAWAGKDLSGPVTLGANGTWSVAVDVTAFYNRCLVRLRDPAVALTAGPAPGTTGPTVTFGYHERTIADTGPNTGQLVDWYAAASQDGAYNDYGSPSWWGGIYDTLLYNGPDVRASLPLWYWNASPYGATGLPITSRGGLIVDGLYAYTLDQAAVADLPNAAKGVTLPGLSGMSVTAFPDPVTGAIGSDQVVPVVRCNAGADAPDPTAACTAWVRTGVVLHRSVRFGSDGTTTRVSDRWVSDDGAAHTVRLQMREDVNGGPNSPGFRFGWVDGAAFKTHAAGDVIVPPPAGQWRVDVVGDSLAPDGDLTYSRGSLVTDRTPSEIRFRSTEDFVRVYDLAVPAGGDVRMEQGYVIAATLASQDAKATAMSDAISGPQVSITSPANGATLTASPVTVTGRATDAVGVTSATVNGQPVTPAADGSFTTSLALTSSPTTITLVAKDAAGNSAQTQVTVNFAPPSPPAGPPPPAAPKCPTRPRFNSVIYRDGVTSFYYRPLPGQEILGARRFGAKLRVMLRTPAGRSRLPRVEYTTARPVDARRLPWFARKVGPNRVVTAIMANADASKYSGIRLAYQPRRGTYAKLILPKGNVRTVQAGCPKVTGYATIYAQNIFVKRASK